MNKQSILEKIRLITEELHQQTSEWVKGGYEVKALDVEAYFSNINYLREQSAILRQLLQESLESGKATNVEIPSIPNKVQSNEEVQNPKPSEKHLEDELIAAIGSKPASAEVPATNPVDMQDLDARVTAKVEVNEDDKQSLNDRLSSVMDSHAHSLRHSFSTKDLTLSLNEKIFAISKLFNDDHSDFSRVMAHLATLDGWEEVEPYLEATCVVPYGWNDKQMEKEQFYSILKNHLGAE